MTTKSQRGRPRKAQRLSGAERARRYRARSRLRDQAQLTQILRLVRNSQ